MSFTSDLEDITQNPHKYGAPTFEEFARQPQKYVRAMEQVMIAPDRGSSAIGHLVKTQKYFFRDGKGKIYDCKTLDAVHKVADSEGVHFTQLDYDPQVVPTGDGRCEIHVTFFRKPLVPGLMIPR
jgi:hypothetical protein